MSTVTLELLRDEKSFGLVFHEGMRITEIDPGTPAARSGLRPLDLVVACDGERVSAYSIAQEISGKRTIELTIVRPAEKDLCRVARDENVDEWMQWEYVVVASAHGDHEALGRLLLGPVLPADSVSRRVDFAEAVARRLTPLEATAFNLAHNLQLASGSRLEDIARQHQHVELAAELQAQTEPRTGTGTNSTADYDGDVAEIDARMKTATEVSA